MDKSSTGQIQRIEQAIGVQRARLWEAANLLEGVAAALTVHLGDDRANCTHFPMALAAIARMVNDATGSLQMEELLQKPVRDQP